VFRKQADSDTAGDIDQHAIWGDEVCGDGAQHARRHRSRIVHAFHAGQADQKLVAAHSRNRIIVANMLPQSSRRFAQALVTRRMPRESLMI